MPAYLTIADFRVRSVMPAEDVDVLEAAYPGFLDSKLAEHSSWIDGRLRKRYACPFAAPVPEIVLSWLERLTTLDAFMRRGFNPSSEQDGQIIERAKIAREEVKEAADAREGLYDLPAREDLPVSGVTDGGPLGYAEASPYTWATLQREAARHE